MKNTNREHTCPSCGKETKLDNFVGGVCYTCHDNGVWVDPAGGIHHNNDADYDPAKMYE